MTEKFYGESKKFHGLALRYLIVGGFTFCAYFVLLYLCEGVLRMSYPVAVGISYFTALSVHFTLNRWFTFRAAAHAIPGQLARYAATALLNYLVQIAMIFALYQWLHVNFYLSALVSVCTNLLVGFLLQHFWVFRVPQSAGMPQSASVDSARAPR